MLTVMLASGPGGSTAQRPARLIIAGVDDSAEAEAAALWAVRDAELRKADVLLVHAHEVPLLPSRGMAAAIAQGRRERQALLDTVAGTLAMPPRMHLDLLIEMDSPASALARLSENAELTVLGQDHPARSPACHDILWWRCLAAGGRESDPDDWFGCGWPMAVSRQSCFFSRLGAGSIRMAQPCRNVHFPYLLHGPWTQLAESASAKV
jgi:hypothetical protein